VRWGRSKNDVGTDIIITRATIVTSSTRSARFNSNTVANLDVLDLIPNFDDNASTFMPQHNWALEDKISDTASLPVMDIATADARLLKVNSDVVLVAQPGHGALFEAYFLDSLKDKGVNLLLLTLVSLLVGEELTISDIVACGNNCARVDCFVSRFPREKVHAQGTVSVCQEFMIDVGCRYTYLDPSTDDG
jgi:hypothetical protein